MDTHSKIHYHMTHKSPKACYNFTATASFFLVCVKILFVILIFIFFPHLFFTFIMLGLAVDLKNASCHIAMNKKKAEKVVFFGRKKLDYCSRFALHWCLKFGIDEWGVFYFISHSMDLTSSLFHLHIKRNTLEHEVDMAFAV